MVGTASHKWSCGRGQTQHPALGFFIGKGAQSTTSQIDGGFFGAGQLQHLKILLETPILKIDGIRIKITSIQFANQLLVMKITSIFIRYCIQKCVCSFFAIT